MHVKFGLHFDGLQPQRPTNATGWSLLVRPVFSPSSKPGLGFHLPSSMRVRHLSPISSACEPSRHRAGSSTARSWSTRSTSRARSRVAGPVVRGGLGRNVPRHRPARLADMAAVEALARDSVPPSPGERLGRVAAALSGRVTQIDGVELHTSPDALPYAWQTVLAALPCELASGIDPASAGPEGSDLARVQARLLAIADGTVDGIAERERLQGDGSLMVVRSASRDLSAEAIAEFIRDTGQYAETLLVAERDGVILDHALERVLSVTLFRRGFLGLFLIGGCLICHIGPPLPESVVAEIELDTDTPRGGDDDDACAAAHGTKCAWSGGEPRV